MIGQRPHDVPEPEDGPDKVWWAAALRQTSLVGRSPDGTPTRAEWAVAERSPAEALAVMGPWAMRVRASLLANQWAHGGLRP